MRELRGVRSGLFDDWLSIANQQIFVGQLVRTKALRFGGSDGLRQGYREDGDTVDQREKFGQRDKVDHFINAVKRRMFIFLKAL